MNVQMTTDEIIIISRAEGEVESLLRKRQLLRWSGGRKGEGAILD